jgi:hypothetical protein
MSGSALSLASPLVSALVSLATGGRVIGTYHQRRKDRTAAADAVVALNDPGAFSRRAFMAFLYGPLTLIFTLMLVLIVGIVATGVWLVFDDVARSSLSESTVIRSAMIVIVIALALLGAWGIEPYLQLRFLPMRFRRWEAERIAAKRVKADKDTFVVDPDQCEYLALGLLQKLQKNPEWLFGTLLPEDGDPATLPNEIMFGVLFEQLLPNVFDPEWQRFLLLRSASEYRTSRYLLHPEQIRVTSRDEVAGKLKEFFGKHKLIVTTHAMGYVATVAERLRERYGGDAARLLRIAAPRGASAVLFAVVSIALWAVMGRHGVMHLALAGNRYAIDSGVIVTTLAAAVLFHAVIAWRQWIAYILVRSRIWGAYDCIGWRLSEFPIFRFHPGARTAFLKFVSEYGLVHEDIDVRVFGDSTHVRLALLNAGAIRTDGETFGTSDPDLKFYTQSALRLIANHLDRLLREEPRVTWRRSLPYIGAQDGTGQFLGVNIADGAMFLTGKEYCGQSSWKHPVSDCPAAAICEVHQGTRFKLDNENLGFKRDPRPEASA